VLSCSCDDCAGIAARFTWQATTASEGLLLDRHHTWDDAPHLGWHQMKVHRTWHTLSCPAHLLYTAPVGLDGVHRISSRERGVRAARKASAVSTEPLPEVSTTTECAPASRAISG
jgi:hypothetical protein